MLLRAALGLLAGLCATVVVADGGAGGKDLGSVLAGNKNLTKYYDLIKKYPDILLQLPSYQGVTIVAPSNKAFENIPYTSLNGQWDPDDKAKTVPLLQYHILQGNVSVKDLETGPTVVKKTLLTDSKYTNVTSGQNVLVNKQPGDVVVFTTSMGTRCTLVEGDIAFQGGLIQVVDNLLIPPARLDKTSEAFKVSSFLGALYAAKLMPDLAYRKNVTIFAPQDEAFALVGGGLEKLDAQKLSRVMGYHVVTDQVLVSSAFSNGTKLATLAKSGGDSEKVTVRIAGNNKYVNSAQIVQPDILIANGILHLVSDVLNPDAGSEAPNPTLGTQVPVFPVSSVKDAFTSALPCSTDCPVTTTTAGGSDASGAATATTSSSSFRSSSSKGGAMPARATGGVMGAAAIGLLGVGAGVAPWL
ncbi:fasciclin domain-containing protein [Purpureocillium lavendulum]|uniref:Fasciclin domain-containing protein n=1 Tax=Purpureocillium lavendulum TaxID=1247861 RepID=A0AB34G9I8_9HYPO|nr:fasciclin domain-containing protein [Purpureocillium lavendulum]